jgi:DNA-binding FadR family transcriptional regulator
MEAAISGNIPRVDQLIHIWTQDWRDADNAVARRLAALEAKRQADLGLEASSESRTLSEQLARRLLHEIRSMNWPVGMRLGDEPDMLARYDVSRATFRQAVRMLEQYFAVQTKRGPGGGLFVTSPAPARVNELTVASLLSAGVNAGHVQEARGQLVGLAFDLTLGRGAAGRDELQAMLSAGAAAAQHEPQGAVRSLYGDLGRASAARSCEFTLDLLLLLLDRLGVAGSAADQARCVAWVMEQAAASLRAGDDARAKRALLDVVSTAGAALAHNTAGRSGRR